MRTIEEQKERIRIALSRTDGVEAQGRLVRSKYDKEDGEYKRVPSCVIGHLGAMEGYSCDTMRMTGSILLKSKLAREHGYDLFLLDEVMAAFDSDVMDGPIHNVEKVLEEYENLRG